MLTERNDWVKRQMELYKKANEQVLNFIADFRFHCGIDSSRTIEKLFSEGYCYYFAHMLQLAFGRGVVCYVFCENHFVWLDGVSELTDTAYDICGVNKRWEHLIPEDKLGDIVLDFKHIKGVQSPFEENECMTRLLRILEK